MPVSIIVNYAHFQEPFVKNSYALFTKIRLTLYSLVLSHRQKDEQ